MLPDSGQNGTPERCAARAASAHQVSRPGRRSAAGSRAGGPRSSGAGEGAVSGVAGRGRSITRQVLEQWAVGWRTWDYGRYGPPVRSAARTVPVVDRQQGDRQQAHPERGPRGARHHQHAASAPHRPPREQHERCRSPTGAGSSIRTRPTGAATHVRPLPRAAWRSPMLSECPDRPAAPR